MLGLSHKLYDALAARNREEWVDLQDILVTSSREIVDPDIHAACAEIENVGSEFLAVRRNSTIPREVLRITHCAALPPTAVQPRELRVCEPAE
jgi:hypothetical protein